MKLDFLSLVFGLLFIPVIFLFCRQKLKDPKFVRLLLMICIVLAAIGLATILFVEVRPNFYLFLICPIYSLILHQLLLKWFRARLHRDPLDTTFLWFPKNDVTWDRIFNIGFLLLSVSGPVFLLAIIFPK